MSRKGTITSRTLQKLGLRNFRFRSNSDPPIPDDTNQEVNSNRDSYKQERKRSSIDHSDIEKLAIQTPLQQTDESSKKERESKSVFYIDSDAAPDLLVPDKESELTGSMQEKKKKVRPEGTIEHTVSDRETLEKIAARYDTTPSELKKINRLSSWMIFSGQMLFVPDKDFKPEMACTSSVPTSQAVEVSDQLASSSPLSSPKHRPTMDVPIVKLADKPPSVVPGHVERQTPVSSPTDKIEVDIVPPTKLSEDEAKQLDQDCHERFIKLRVKHITDGQGVVKGTLLVTPNAVMFDPDVLDPLVQEHGAEKYGMIAPMDLIISAAMYHDIAVMSQRGKRRADGSPFPKPEIYHDKSNMLTAMKEEETEELDTNSADGATEKTVKVEADNNCSCSHNFEGIAGPSLLESDYKGDKFPMDTQDEATDQMIFSEGEECCTDSCGEAVAGKPQTDAHSLDSVGYSDNENVIQTDKHTESNTEESDSKTTQIGNIVYLPVEEDDKGQVTLQAFEETQTALSKLSTDDFESSKKTDSEISDGGVSVSATSDSKDIQKKRTSSTSSLGSFNSSPALNAFVNYATGLFQRGSDEKTGVKDIKEVFLEEKKSVDIPMVSAAPRSNVSGKNQHQRDREDSSGSQDIAVESAVSMDEHPDLFSLDFNKFKPRQSVQYTDPPLYLCLRLGTPQNKVFHNYSIESYGKRKKEPEYWFSIPRAKVDHLYAFFVQWTPEIYGDEEEMDAEKRGFVVIGEDDELNEEMDTFDDHFGPNSSFQKDWEIISKAEAVKRRSIIFDIPIPLPDLIGTSTILNDDYIVKLNQFLPPRTVGYPWTLVYSTDKHGFSLKTLYRDMQGLDSPILIIVKDTSDCVFGAVTSCELKMSDHFYGTGESFLYTFHPEFRMFPWTGENNFFLKGNRESLAIGAGKGVFGLWFDGDIYHGRTNQCETYNNDILTVSEDFVVKAFEAWAFIQDG